MKSAAKLEIEVANLLGWVRDIEYHVKHHDFSFAAEIASDFVMNCRRVNQIANDLSDEDDANED